MKIHFIGIGGIGVSALAKYYLEKGHKITGSDLTPSEITKDLKEKGVRIFIGPHDSKNTQKNVDLVIYSPAVQSTNPEFKEAKRRNIKMNSYPEALGELTKNHYTIAITGTHGKSTTTCMMGLLLARAGLDPTVIVGTKLKEFGNSNYRGGKSQYLVIEACEHFESFLNYWPKIIILTSVEADHLDYYKNLGNVLRGFKRFISNLPKDGILIANRDDKNIRKILSSVPKLKTYKYSLKQPETRKLKRYLSVPGEHNISNALAALTVARILKVTDDISYKALSEYKGSWRRFEEKTIKIWNKNLKLISDYGHHPTEVKVTLKAAREKYLNKKIWCVFQPHQYQRTYYLFKDFVKVFKESPVDKLIITDIYDVAGRETPELKKKVSSEKLVKATNRKNVIYLQREKVLDYLKENLADQEVLIVMGAGDIYNLTLSLTRS
ncbi:MAG: UDP-N-acetylmuramate--L-alanine ligase [Candidatus Paceibacterota bacterium]